MAESIPALGETAEEGSRGIKAAARYDGPKTPFERVVASKQGDAAQLSILKELQRSLDPFQLAKIIDRKLNGFTAWRTAG